jgi:hypothetical protein
MSSFLFLVFFFFFFFFCSSFYFEYARIFNKMAKKIDSKSYNRMDAQTHEQAESARNPSNGTVT